MALGIDNVSPTVATTIARSEPVTFRVTTNGGESNLGLVIVSVSYADAPDAHVLYSGTAFTAAADASSTVEVTSGDATFTIAPAAPGWLDSPSISVLAHDAAGNVLQDSVSWTVVGYPFAVDTTVADPVEGSVLVKYDPVTLTVVDDGTETYRLLAYLPGTDTAEVVWDGDAFTDMYSGSSRTVTAVTEGDVVYPTGWVYRIKRTAGWLRGGVSFRVLRG